MPRYRFSADCHVSPGAGRKTKPIHEAAARAAAAKREADKARDLLERIGYDADVERVKHEKGYEREPEYVLTCDCPYTAFMSVIDRVLEPNKRKST